MEWTSLSLFTVLSEAAIGLVLIYALFGVTAAAKEKSDAYGRLGHLVLLSAGLTTGVAMLISLEHLGWPQFAFRALAGLPSSWLSWEVLLTGLFAGGAVAMAWGTRRSQAAGQAASSAAANGKASSQVALPSWAYGLLAAVGLAATYASGMIYTLPSLPANAGGAPVLFFLTTTLLTGAALLLLLLLFTAPGKELAPSWLTPLALGAVGAALLTVVLTLAYAGGAAAGTPEAQVQASLFAGSAWYLVRLLVGLVLPALLLSWTTLRGKPFSPVVALPAVLLLAGELAGRLLFFASSTFTGINTGF